MRPRGVLHPNPESFNAQICRAYVEELEARGHEVVLRDLYVLKFDPILRREDMDDAREGRAADDVRAEQDHVRWADVITFISPIWWISWPAMLKGYVDRVFALNFAYRYGADGVEGCLGARRALIITTSGSTMENFLETGKLRAIQNRPGFRHHGVLRHRDDRPPALRPGRTADSGGPVLRDARRVRTMVRTHF
jgi:NAD(P)H dehydrogenase (quinone)